MARESGPVTTPPEGGRSSVRGRSPNDVTILPSADRRTLTIPESAGPGRSARIAVTASRSEREGVLLVSTRCTTGSRATSRSWSASLGTDPAAAVASPSVNPFNRLTATASEPRLISRYARSTPPPRITTSTAVISSGSLRSSEMPRILARSVLGLRTRTALFCYSENNPVTPGQRAFEEAIDPALRDR